MKFEQIVQEASEFEVEVEITPDRVVFRSEGQIMAWMHRDHPPGKWCGFTPEQATTGRKWGTKAEVASWCLDWAANGF